MPHLVCGLRRILFIGSPSYARALPLRARVRESATLTFVNIQRKPCMRAKSCVRTQFLKALAERAPARHDGVWQTGVMSARRCWEDTRRLRAGDDWSFGSSA